MLMMSEKQSLLDHSSTNSSTTTTAVSSTNSSTTTTTVPSTGEDGSKKKECVWVVAMCTLTACLASLIAGMNVGFSSPALVQLENANFITESQRFNSTTMYSNIFGSLGTMGAMFGGLFAWPISDLLGRKVALILGGLPFLSGWLLIANSIQITNNRAGFIGVLFGGRILTGFATGWSVFCASVYIAEISSTKYRGLFGNCNQLFMTFGTLLIYFFGIKINGYEFTYYNIALIAAGFATLFILLMLFTFETPRWLIIKKKKKRGEEVLRVIRGSHYPIEDEIGDIDTVVYSVMEQLLEFRHQRVYHPFILVIVLMFFQQFSGINIVIFYAAQTFKDVGYGDDKANLVTLFAVGLVQVFATFISVILVDYLGRRTLLIVSSIGLALSSFLLGLYFCIFDNVCKKSLVDSQCPHHIEYLAIISVVVFIISFSLGWGPIPWSSMSELLPNQVRTLGASVANFVNWGFAFIITLAIQGVNPIGAWWGFSVFMVVSIVFVFLFIPEARGRSLEDMKRYFEMGNIIVPSCKRCSLKHAAAMDTTSDFMGN